MEQRFYYTYITASRTHSLYSGITNDMGRRIAEHKEGAGNGFTAKYRCNRLVWFERYQTSNAAIAREKQLKGWRRTKKLALIEKQNPTWIDLGEDWGKAF
jgi:putative endonuclease